MSARRRFTVVTAVTARAGAATLLTVGALTAGVVGAGEASAATPTVNCDTAAQPSTDWTTCQQLTASAKCVWNNGDGTWTMAMGYTNPTGSNLFASIPNTGTNTGTNNALTATNGSAGNPSHPTTFPPGTSTTAFTVTWTPASKTDPIQWVLMGHTTTWADTITACPAKPVSVVQNAALGGTGVAVLGGLVLFGRRRRRPLAAYTMASA